MIGKIRWKIHMVITGMRILEDWDWDDWKDDVGLEPIDLDLEHELAILSILFFIYILAIIYVFTKKKNNLVWVY